MNENPYSSPRDATVAADEAEGTRPLTTAEMIVTGAWRGAISMGVAGIVVGALFPICQIAYIKILAPGFEVPVPIGLWAFLAIDAIVYAVLFGIVWTVMGTGWGLVHGIGTANWQDDYRRVLPAFAFWTIFLSSALAAAYAWWWLGDNGLINVARREMPFRVASVTYDITVWIYFLLGLTVGGIAGRFAGGALVGALNSAFGAPLVAAEASDEHPNSSEGPSVASATLGGGLMGGFAGAVQGVVTGGIMGLVNLGLLATCFPAVLGEIERHHGSAISSAIVLAIPLAMFCGIAGAAIGIIGANAARGQLREYRDEFTLAGRLWFAAGCGMITAIVAPAVFEEIRPGSWLNLEALPFLLGLSMLGMVVGSGIGYGIGGRLFTALTDRIWPPEEQAATDQQDALT